MKASYRYRTTIVLLVCLLCASCAAAPQLPRGQNLALSDFVDPLNQVAVAVQLIHAVDGTFLVQATFTPPPGYHLYSKDTPITGVRGQGRPTLLEFPAGAKTKPAGTLTESVTAMPLGYTSDGPLVYPVGPVTLSQAVRLPAGQGWIEDTIQLTYMACTPSLCLAPTVRKSVAIKIPGMQSLQP